MSAVEKERNRLGKKIKINQAVMEVLMMLEPHTDIGTYRKMLASAKRLAVSKIHIDPIFYEMDKQAEIDRNRYRYTIEYTDSLLSRKQLLRRYHPDNIETGDIDKFKEINNGRR